MIKINIVVLKNHKQFIGNKSILKTHQRFKSESHNIFTSEIMIALSSNDDEKQQSFQ